ncbi:MAG: tyrosine--tRNA ligase, partial [Bacteroidales bacterium]|nr:tyrosine--tRNA ligase [Bacteroidales bacterium]
AKDSVKKRLSRESSEGMSFTEFSYQLMQGYDFYWLWKNRGCILQFGGSDQWGNITTGNELIRRMDGGEAFALTCPLIRKADGTKFGKTEKGNIWLDPERTSPYEFYQFWLNVADVDAESYIRIFTMLDRQAIEDLIARHRENPGARELQKVLAREVTLMCHGQEALDKAVEASQMLFGGNSEALKRLDERTFLAVFADVPSFEIHKEDLPCNIMDFLAVKTAIMPSKGEARKMVQGGGISLNKDKVTGIERDVTADDIVNGHYILAQKGKKNYFIVNVI